MNTHTASAPASAASWLSTLPRALRWPLFTLVTGLIVVAAWAVRHGGYYKPGDDLGYYMGLTGALMMLVLLLYPLRKHLRIMQNFGPIKYWFRLHMTCGILGPTLVVFHSTFHVGSLNAAVAMYSMLLVAGSGIIGRYVYSRIHHGLYGHATSLQELERNMGSCAGNVETRLHFAPAVEERLRAFHSMATRHDGHIVVRAVRFMTIGLHAKWARWQCLRLLRKIETQHRARSSTAAKLSAEAGKLVTSYLSTVQNVAQFKTFERMFSLWHILHIPIVYTLAASAVFHVIAVHMY